MSVAGSLQSLAEQVGGSGIRAGHAAVAELRRAMSSGSLSAAEVTAFYLDRIERFNPELHAVITVSPDAAKQAAASDARRAAGSALGPLDGIPMLVKDNIAVAGLPATAGSPALQGTESGEAFCVAGLRAAGAVILARRICPSGRTFARRNPAAAGARWADRRSTRTAPAATRLAPARARRSRWPQAWPRSQSEPRPTGQSS
jgi:hypothetical protein